MTLPNGQYRGEPAWHKAERERCSFCGGKGHFRRGVPPYDDRPCTHCPKGRALAARATGPIEF